VFISVRRLTIRKYQEGELISAEFVFVQRVVASVT